MSKTSRKQLTKERQDNRERHQKLRQELDLQGFASWDLEFVGRGLDVLEEKDRFFPKNSKRTVFSFEDLIGSDNELS